MSVIPRKRLDDRVFNIASTLFGYPPNTTEQDPQKTIAMPLQLNERIIAIYPAIIDKAFKSTMDNFRSYIASYNFKTQGENELIAQHNISVKAYCEQNELSAIQTTYKALFLQKNKSITQTRAYNQAVTDFCQQYGNIIEKKKIQSVKYATEVVFQNLLHLYNAQLMHRNEKFIKAGITAKRPLQEFKINSFLVTQLKPYIDSNYRTKTNKMNTAIGGSSLGGLVSYYAILKYPEIFGKAMVFSPSFWFNEEMYSLTENAKKLKTKLYFMCGDNESETMVSDMDKMVHLVNEKRCTCMHLTKKVVVTGGKHNENLWAKEFGKAYLWLF